MATPDREDITKRRHPEWQEHNLRWRFLLDSFEGGEAYRDAVYGTDLRGFPVRNLIRHKREYPDPREAGLRNAYLQPLTGGDPAVYATDDDYNLRLARTPVPTLVPDRVEAHLSAVYAREVDREAASAPLKSWWDDVDGLGTTADEWMSTTVAPLLMVLGCLDVVCDHPPPPEGEVIDTRADALAHRLDRCVASVILPENMVWWRLDDQHRYLECLVCELHGDDSETCYRHWTADAWTLYDCDQKVLAGDTHPYGRPPIVRLFDRKRPRCVHVGLPRYESIAELQREYYNLDSELALTHTTQAHPLLQGPEDYIQSDGTVPVGPSWLLPKKKNATPGNVMYEGFDVVDFPKGGALEIRESLNALIDRADRAAMLTKPAGTKGTTGNTVSQSGISKRLDQAAGSHLLAKIAGVLQKAEGRIADLALLVLGDGKPDPAADVTVTYPRSFDLMTADELSFAVTEFQAIVASAGKCPVTEGELLERLVRLMLPGLLDPDYDEIDAEIDAFLKAAAADLALQREAANVPETPNGTASAGTAGPANVPVLAAQSPAAVGPAADVYAPVG